MKQLLGYQISGQTIGVDITTWNDGDLNGNKPFVIILSGSTIPSGYTDISSIYTWYNFGFGICNDYLCIKEEIKDFVNNIGWSGLTSAEKDIAITCYSYASPTDPVIYLMTVKSYTLQQAQSFLLSEWHKHHGNVVEACKQRWFYLKLIIAAFLSFTDAEDLFDKNESLIFAYTDMGRLGLNYGDKKNGIMDMIQSTNGYENNGLRESGYVLNQGNYDMFISAVHGVLIHGFYTKYSE
jgi:hypothetical protein